MTGDCMKNYFKDWTLFEKLILTLGLSITAAVSILTHSTLLSLINGICNILNSVLSAKGKISNYYFGIIGNIIYLYISYTTRYYSEVITVLFIVLPISIYGLINWLKGRRNEESDSVSINSPTAKAILIPILSQVVMSVPYYLMLKHFNSDLLIVSAFGMCVTILAFYFMAKAYTVFNYFFIINAITRMIMWIVPMLKGDFANVPLFLSNLIYLINDIYSLFNWKRMEKQQNQTR